MDDQRKRLLDDDHDGDRSQTPAVKKHRVDENLQDSQNHNGDQVMDYDEMEENNPEIEDGMTCGKILQIQLSNFMCHSNLTVSLGKNVNFVMGRNGSGKSAIMTGIIICLGGRSSATNRASSLKDFIKKGAKYARIIITLANEGSDGYRKNDFGQKIILERHLWNDGHSTYKLKSASGRIISNEKKELRNLLEYYNIQVDNPVCFLTQDASREFLRSQNASRKYQFFLKATQLDQIFVNFVSTQDVHEVLSNAIQRKSRIVEEQKQVVENHRLRLRDIDSLQKIEDQLQDLKVLLAWAYVGAEEEKLQQLNSEITATEMTLAKAERNYNDANKNKEKVNESKKDMDSQIEIFTDQLNNLQQKNISLNEAKKSNRDDKLSWNNKCQVVKHSIKDAENDRDMLRRKITEITERDQDTQAAVTRKMKIASLAKELEGLKSELSHATDQKSKLEYNRKKEESNLQELRAKISTYDNKKNQLEIEITRLESSSQDRLKVYGNFMPELVRRIREAHQKRLFHKLPYGPLGQNVTLKDEKWAVAVDACLRELLASFYCHDNHDKDIIKGICRQMNVPKMPAIVVSRFLDVQHNISESVQPCRYPTVLDMLSINDCNVINCFIDQKGIENILLIEDRSDAMAFMRSKSVPRNVKQAYIINGDLLYGGNNTRYYANYRQEVRYLIQNVTDEIKKRRTAVESCNQRMSQYNNEMTPIKRTIDQNKSELYSMHQSIKNYQDKINFLKNEIDELQSYENSETDLTELESEYRTREEEIKGEKKQLETFLRSYHEAVAKATELEDQLNDLGNEIREMVDNIAMHKEKRKENELQYINLNNRCKELKTKIDKLCCDKEEKSQSIAIQEDKVATSIEGASKLSKERRNSRWDITELNKKINRAMKRLQDQEKETGTREDILTAFSAAKKKFDEQRSHLTLLEDTSQQLRSQLKIRKKLFKKMREILTARVVDTFSRTLTKRGYLGNLQINHSEEKILINVKITSNAKSAGTGSLSGGERSFSTVAFIVSLWEAMDSPFQCLDEFDVFMDMVNRDLCMDTLLKLAMSRELRQFIFLSPQNMSKLRHKKNIKIHRLQDPTRESNQPTITDSLVRRD